ncbi:3-deoxy-manno-octulosonate cytidylyltransferase [Vreelandella piezotolerans]|uniref:3-deoxy-manno-octulosonate cytidylyltransferase n=1 Tax=Vreelandella piezotolerans TaxID=2609667 RepID=UPI001C62C223
MSSNSHVALVIPARYGSSRLPGKPLADLLGKPMVQWVYEKAQRVPSAQTVVVATDDERIADAVRAFGGNVVITSPNHPSGTDRLVEVMGQVEADIYINLQGDEPLIRPEDVEQLAQGMLFDPSVDVGTLYHAIEDEEAQNPNVVKVVLGQAGNALYFSRSPIPFPREGDQHPGFKKHVGVYAYRKRILEQYAHLPASALEQTEQLEQLRLLSAGVSIRAFQVEPTGPGVDTPACLEKVRAILEGKPYAPISPLANVKLLITDVDGVLTDGGIYYDATGECLKRFHVRDGLGMRLLEECGIRVAVLSGRDSATLRKRVADLGIGLHAFGVKDKYAACRALMKEAGVTPEQTVCIGDDSIDLPAFAACGLSYAVADAPSYVKQHATGILSLAGGQGAVRELADAILSAHGMEDVFNSAKGFHSVSGGAAQ